MKENYLEKLEFNKIIEKLSLFCDTFLGKDLATKLQPSKNIDEVKHSLSETEEAISVMYKCGIPPLSEIANHTETIKILESFGTLSAKSILGLAHIFKIAEDLKKYFFTEYLSVENFPILNSYFSELYSNLSITEIIFSSILDENTISDTASKALSTIRKKQRSLTDNVKAKLNDFIHSSKYSKYIQESVITIRNGRYVIPIKEEYQSEVKGFVHDISSSGSTIFIEPISIFELNNEIHQLKAEESLEIEKILQELTKLFYPYVVELKTDIKQISIIDFVFAKAKYSKSLNANTPKINTEKYIILNNARHPLLDAKTAIPISLTLGKEFATLLITGPNTGGKTVTLKTVGLLTCMACSGLNIPADSNSSIYVFDHIFTDIGDGQSISDSLSTFSSHISNIVDIIGNANNNSLVLVDELGSGTDPAQGAALAISILQYIKNLGALTIATTHYPELKKYALIADGFENASVEFDINTLSPTYKLLMGVPGKSNAFDISKRLGLNYSIIQNAETFLDKNDIDFEELLKNIYDDKSKIEKEKIEIKNELDKVRELRKNLECSIANTEEQSKKILQEAKLEARNLLLESKEEATSIIKKMNQIKTSISNEKELNNYRNHINEKIRSIKIINEDISTESTKNNSNTTISKDSIIPGKSIWVNNLNQEGTILSHISKSNEVLVQIGNIKMNVPISVLNPSHNIGNKKTNPVNFSNISKVQNAKTEVNVIGLNVEEATFVVDKFLDDSSLAKLKSVRIVHGKGTGKLREGIHKFLKKNPLVKSFRLGNFGEGEMGVTIVELK